jgi:hypothetical protein
VTIRATFVVPLRDGAGTGVLRGGRGTGCGRTRSGARSRGGGGGRLLSRLITSSGRLAAGSLATSRRRSLRRCGALATTGLSCILRQHSRGECHCQYK